MKDIIERLDDEEMCMDAIDDAISEIEQLRSMLESALPLVDAMVGIGSAARPLKAEIEEYFKKVKSSGY